jgi:hypothetical protein
MKNKEKYTKEIVDIVCEDVSFGVDKRTGSPASCRELHCGKCLLNEMNRYACYDSRKEWADSEYVERPVISKNDRRFLDYIGNTYKYIVRDKDGKLFVCKKVYVVNDEWFTRGCIAGSDYTYISGFDVQFPMVKVISPTVWSIEDLKKLEVVEAYKEA